MNNNTAILAKLKSLPLVRVFNRASKGNSSLRTKFYKIGWVWHKYSDDRRINLFFQVWSELLHSNANTKKMLDEVTGGLDLPFFLLYDKT